MGDKQCSAYDENSMTCSNGFVQKMFCRDGKGCQICGTLSGKATPYCLRDEIPERFITDSGSPVFYSQNKPSTIGEE